MQFTKFRYNFTNGIVYGLHLLCLPARIMIILQIFPGRIFVHSKKSDKGTKIRNAFQRIFQCIKRVYCRPETSYAFGDFENGPVCRVGNHQREIFCKRELFFFEFFLHPGKRPILFFRIAEFS